MVARRGLMGRTLLATFLVGLVVGGCAAASSPSPPAPGTTGPSATPAPTATPEPTHGFRGTVTLADGRKLAASCAGTGSPTVFLEGGGLTPSISDWPASLISDLADITTVCRYSRAGATGSSTAPRPRHWADVLADADQLLAGLHDEAGVSGPYIYLGWSLGGSFALGEVMEDPSRVAGLVILDTDFPVDFLAVCPLSGRSKAECRAEYDGDLEAKLIEAGIAKSIKPLPMIPVRVLTAMRNPDCLDPAPGATLSTSIAGVQLTAKDCASMSTKVADKMAADWGMLSPDFEQIRVQSSHDELPGFAHARIAQVIAALVAARRGA